MPKNFDELLARAKSLYVRTRDMDRDHAELEIVGELAAIYSDGTKDMIDEVEARLITKK